jgi:Flp pilus assembly pilin Flp
MRYFIILLMLAGCQTVPIEKFVDDVNDCNAVEIGVATGIISGGWVSITNPGAGVLLGSLVGGSVWKAIESDCSIV